MWNIIDLLLACTMLWLFVQTALILLVSSLYLTVPWLVWGTLAIYLLIRFAARIPPPHNTAVQKVLGVDPITFHQQDLASNKNETEDVDLQYCIRIIAHRGAAYDYPENSMTAFRSSQERGCDAVEFDLTLTKDNVPIIFHDVTIDRLTGYDGFVSDMTWDQLKDYDISANHPLRSKVAPQGEKIALFEEVLKETLKNGQHMFIDIKAKGNEVVKVILEAFKHNPKLYEKAVITSFNPITIYSIRRKDPKIVAGLSWRPMIFSQSTFSGITGAQCPRFDNFIKNYSMVAVDAIHNWALSRITYYVCGLSFVILHKDVVSPDIIHDWNKKGVRVFAWAVNLPTEKAYFSRNLRISYLTDTLI